eukprot:2892817-Prymnesium_polylepis.1
MPLERLEALDVQLGAAHEIVASRIAEQRSSERNCAVCLDRPKKVAFGCGHQACEECAPRQTQCHTCRARIKQRINLFARCYPWARWAVCVLLSRRPETVAGRARRGVLWLTPSPYPLFSPA